MTRKESKLFVRKSLIKDYRRREASVKGYGRVDRKAAEYELGMFLRQFKHASAGERRFILGSKLHRHLFARGRQEGYRERN